MLAVYTVAECNVGPRWAPRVLIDIHTLTGPILRLALTISACRTMPFAPPSSHANDVSAAIAAELPKVRRHAVALLYNRADAEDLVQDCLEAALTKQSTLQDPRRLRGWLFAILHNLFLMRMRSTSRRGSTISIDDFADDLIASVAPEDRSTALDLARAMGQLTLEHRQILLLLNVEGYSYEEIATILDVPIGTVMSRLARARQRLRTLIEGVDSPAAARRHG